MTTLRAARTDEPGGDPAPRAPLPCSLDLQSAPSIAGAAGRTGPFPAGPREILPGLGDSAFPALVLLALAAGCFFPAAPAWGTALLGCAVAGAVRWFRPARYRLAASSALFLLALAGWRSTPEPFPKQPSGPEARFLGEVVEDSRSGIAGPRVVVDLVASAPAGGGQWEPTAGRAIVQVDGDPAPSPAWGDAALFRARLRPAAGLRNPGSEGFESYLFRQGIQSRASGRSPGSVAFAEPGPGTPAWLRWRREVSADIERAVPGPAGAVLRALTVGDRSGLTQETFDSFREAGTAHLISISGLHLGILALLLVPPFRWVLVRIPRLALRHPVDPIARTLTLPAMAFYACLSGFQTSALRALVMAATMVLGTALSRSLSPLSLLCATAVVVALPNPAALGDPGFQLSLAGLAGLFWLTPRLDRATSPAARPLDKLLPPPAPAIRMGRSALRALRIGLCAAVAATLTTAPVSMFHFGTVSVLGFVANPVAVPLVSFFCLPLALAGIAVDPLLPGLASALWWISGQAIHWLLALQGVFVGHLPALNLPELRTPMAVAGMAGGLVWLGFVLDGRGRSRTATALLVASLCAVALPPFARWAWARIEPRAHLWVFDVGHGQALGMRLPGARWVAIDGGGFAGSPFDTGERVVVPALEALGSRRLWLAVSTHPHPDHVSGMPAILRWGRPEALWVPAPFSGDPRYAPLLEVAREVGTRVEWVGSEVFEARAGGAVLQGICASGSKENDRCLVVRVSLGESTVLLPADVEAEGQRWLVEKGFPLRCDFLVAPHHGAALGAYSPFLTAASPAHILVSAGDRAGGAPPNLGSAASEPGVWVLSTRDIGCLHAWFGQGSRGVETGPLR